MALNIGSVTFPLLQGLGGSGSAGAVTFPLLVATGGGGGTGVGIFEAIQGTGIGINIRSPGDLVFPLLEASGYGTQGVIGNGIVKFPLLSSTGQGTPGEVGEGHPKLQLLISAGQGYSQTLGNGAAVFPLLVSTANGLSGEIGAGAISFPLITSSGLASSDSHGHGDADLFLLIVDGYGRCIPVARNRKAIVMNIFNHAVTEYVNFNLNSLALFKGVLIGANEQGLFILGGKDDLGQQIQADIRTGIHDFAKDGVLTLPKEAWLNLRTDGEWELGVEVEEGLSYPYFFEHLSDKIGEVRETLGKGLQERFYRFTLKNRSGSDGDIESLRIFGNAIQPKRR